MKITIHRNGQNYGPYTLQQATQYIADGSLLPADLAWYDGCVEWVSLGQLISNYSSPPEFLAAAPGQPCFSVSLLKLTVLCVTTLGLYDIYWMYQNWKLVKEREGGNLFPFWRAFFGVIWIYPLLKRIRKTLVDHQTISHESEMPAGVLATAWIFICFLYKLPNPFLWLSLLRFVALFPVQLKVNAMNSKIAPNQPLNSRFTWANWLWIIFGGILTILAIIGSFVPDN